MKDAEYIQLAVLTNLLESFVRVYPIEFDEEDFLKFASISGVECQRDDVSRFLRESTVVFRMPDNKYLSRGKLFEQLYFSIKPDRYEIENGILILGDRCIPFTDPSMIPEGFEVVRGRCKTPIKRKIMEIPTGILLDHYKLYGEEYAVQYINMDSCNREIDLAGFEFQLPSSINLSVLDVSDIYRKTGFQFGDRFIFRVRNFLEGTLSLEPFTDHRENPFEPTAAEEAREHWYTCLEDCLLQTFETFGPCRSIDEQLSYAMLLGMQQLNTKQCGSITEFMERTEKVAVTEFGVESRLWFSDRPICIQPPAEEQDAGTEAGYRTDDLAMYEFGIPVTEVILRAFVRDSLWMQDEDDGESLYHRLILNDDMMIPEQADFLKLRLQKLHSIMSEAYNRFTDASVGSVRHAAVGLYAQLLEFVCFLSQSGVPGDCLPQQDYVVFSQVWGHVSKMMEEFELHLELDAKDCANALKSIEGMSYSVADVSPRLRRAVEDWKKKGFSFI